ncbi:Zinc finger protein 106 [Mizuhopecten yessoensis]|uniref:Zinc finger protein 106 n=1 Tax=Mizuhopecten yessoensis TaxID=6573 RepID=A0A210QCI6_MIZYE|nr:Zinc finger protein 106 [Mizuhopecten yessoensis]
MDLDIVAKQSFGQGGTEKDDLECDLCKISYSDEQEFRDHAWSLIHHIKIEKKKKGSAHNCTLCFASCLNIIEYGKHLIGDKHKRAIEGQRRQKDKETMTFQKEALLNKRVQDDSMLPGQLEHEGPFSDPEIPHHYKTSHHEKSHQRSFSQPYIKGKGKGKKKAPKGKGNRLDDNAHHYPSNDIPRFHPRDRNTVFHDDNQKDRFWENEYDVNWESRGFIPQSDRDFHGQSNWETSWWDRNNRNPHQDEFSYYPRYRTHHSQEQLPVSQRGRNKQLKGGKQYRWNRRDNSNERYDRSNQEDDSYWNRGSNSDGYFRNRAGNRWDNTAEEHPADNHFEHPITGGVPDHLTEAQLDISTESDMTGLKRRRTSDQRDQSKSRKKTVNFDIHSQQQKDSVQMDSDSFPTRDNEKSGDLHQDKRYKTSVSDGKRVLEPDSTTEETNLDKKTSKGKKKDKSKKKKSDSVKSVGEVTDLFHQADNSVLEKAEQLCKDLREKREMVKKEREKKERKKKMEKAEEINSQIKNLSKINQSYLRGHIAGCADQISTDTADSDQSSKPTSSKSNVRTRTPKEHDIDDIRKGIESAVDSKKQKSAEKDSDSEMKSSSPNLKKKKKKSTKSKSESAVGKTDLRKRDTDEIVADQSDSPTTKTPVSEQEGKTRLNIGTSSPSHQESLSRQSSRAGTFSPSHQESLSRQSSRASSDLSSDLDPESSTKDSLLKMVNSPRSRKERERLAKMLRSYAFSQNKLSFPRFNLQLSDLTTDLDGVATELRLEDLSADVQLQIAELIEADIKPDLSSLDSLLLESQKSASGDREPSISPDVNKALMELQSSAENVPTRDTGTTPHIHNPESLPSAKSGNYSYLHEGTNYHKNLNKKSTTDEGPKFNLSLHIKTEELNEPEQDTSPSQSVTVRSGITPLSNLGTSNLVLSANKSKPKPKRDTDASMHCIGDSEPCLLENKSEDLPVSSPYSMPQSKSPTPLESRSVQDSSEPTCSRDTQDLLRFRDNSKHVNSKSQADSEPSTKGSNPTWSKDQIEPLSSRNKLEPVQSRNIPAQGWSHDKREPVRDRQLSETGRANPSNKPVTVKQEFPSSQEHTSSQHAVETSLKSKNSYTPYCTLPSLDTGRETAASLEGNVSSWIARNTETGPPLCEDSLAIGNIDSYKPVLRLVDPTVPTGDAASVASRSSSTSESVFDLVYDLSVEEDGLREEMSSTESEIMRLTSLIQTATEQLTTQREHHQKLSQKEQSLRSRRLHVLREAKSLQSLSSEISAKSVDRLFASTHDGGPSGVPEKPLSQDLMAESSDLDSSRDSNFTKVSLLSSFSHDHQRVTFKDGNASDSLLVLSDSSDSHRNRSDMRGVSSPQALKTKRIDQRVFQTRPQPLEPSRDSEGFLEPNKHTLKTFETSKEAARLLDLKRDPSSSADSNRDTVRPISPSRDSVRSADPSRDSVKSVDPSKRSADPSRGITGIRSVELSKETESSGVVSKETESPVVVSKDTVRAFNSKRESSPNRRAAWSVRPIKDSMKSLESTRDSTGSLEVTKDTIGDTKGQAEVDQSISLVGSAELNEAGFVTLKSLLRAKPQEGTPSWQGKEQEMLIAEDNKKSVSPLTTDDQSSSPAVSSTTPELTQPQVTETTKPKVNVQYMGHLPGNLFTGQKENMFEKLQSFLKTKSEHGYKSESSLKSDEIVLDTDSNQESVASNASLGAKIQQYCKGNRRGSTQGDSGSDHTLKGSNSEANTPVRQQSKPPVSPSVSDDRNLSPSRKRRKTKKERDQSSKRKQKEEYVINSSSECSGQDDDNIPLTELRQRILFQAGPNNAADVCMVETGSDDCSARGTEPRRSLLEEVQLDSPNESEENPNPVRSQRFKLGPETLASVRAAVKSTIHRSDKGRTDDSIKQLVGPADSVTQIQVTGQSVFVAYQKSNPCRFNLESGTLLGQYDCSPCCVRSLAVVTIEDKLCLYACGPSERLFLFDCETFAIIKDMELIYQVQCMHESWGRLYLGTDYGAVIGKDAKTGKTFESFQCCDRSVTCISSGIEGVRKILLVAAYTSPIYVCDAISGLLLRMLEGHSKTVFCMQVTGHMVYSGSGDRKVMEHNLVTSEVSWTYDDSEGLIRGVATDKQGRLFFGGHDQYLRCYNRKNHKLHCLFYVGKSPVASNIVIQKDKILYGNKDGVVEVVTLESTPHRCRCGDCSYLFGLKGHLYHHMLSDHLARNSRLFNCPWKGCTNRLSTLHDSKEAEEHLKEHIQ